MRPILINSFRFLLVGSMTARNLKDNMVVTSGTRTPSCNAIFPQLFCPVVVFSSTRMLSFNFLFLFYLLFILSLLNFNGLLPCSILLETSHMQSQVCVCDSPVSSCHLQTVCMKGLCSAVGFKYFNNWFAALMTIGPLCDLKRFPDWTVALY